MEKKASFEGRWLVEVTESSELLEKGKEGTRMG